MQVERTDVSSFVVNQLPDGSKVIIDSANDRVLALNATAGAAWDACSQPATLSAVREQMQSSLGSEITEEIAEQSILQLQEQNLVNTSGLRPSRRQFLTTLTAAVALPLVVSLTVAEQRGFADTARSGAPAGPPSGLPPGPLRPIHEPARGGKLPIQRPPNRPVKGPFGFFS